MAFKTGTGRISAMGLPNDLRLTDLGDLAESLAEFTNRPTTPTAPTAPTAVADFAERAALAASLAEFVSRPVMPQTIAELDHDAIFANFKAGERRFTASGIAEARARADAEDNAAKAVIEGREVLSSRTRLDTFRAPPSAPTMADLDPAAIMRNFKKRERELSGQGSGQK
jgi:hypothetical protein